MSKEECERIPSSFAERTAAYALFSLPSAIVAFVAGAVFWNAAVGVVAGIIVELFTIFAASFVAGASVEEDF